MTTSISSESQKLDRLTDKILFKKKKGEKKKKKNIRTKIIEDGRKSRSIHSK